MEMLNTTRFKRLRDFYPYYLTEHSRPLTRGLHFIGTLIVIAVTVTVIARPEWWLLLLIPVAGYGFAWAGHFFVEKNKPATFKYPLFSLASDFVMFWHILTCQIQQRLSEARKLFPDKR